MNYSRPVLSTNVVGLVRINLRHQSQDRLEAIQRILPRAADYVQISIGMSNQVVGCTGRKRPPKSRSIRPQISTSSNLQRSTS